MFKLITAILILSITGLASSNCDFPTDVCSMAGMQCSSDNSINWGNKSYASWYFDVISFGDLTINNGDIEGRAACRNNFYGYNGISIGDKLTNTIDFSLIVGGNLHWDNTGEVYPLNENIFVGGSVTAPDNVHGRVSGNCSDAGCLNSSFDSMFNFWVQVSSNLSLMNSTANATINNEGTAMVSCSSSVDTVYYVSLTPTQFNAIVGYSISSTCNSSASWVFNIIGSGSVSFNGNSVQATGYVIFNVGPATSVMITSSVNGNIIAPNANVHMNGGTVYGHVIAGNCSNIIQVNRPGCPGQSTAGASGSQSGSASAGNSGSASSDNSGSSTAGNSDAATAGNSGAATADNSGAATADNSGAATAGNSGAATTGNSDSASTDSQASGNVIVNPEDPTNASSASSIAASMIMIAVIAIIA